MELREFYNYKNTLIKDILTDPNIVRLINPEYTIEDSRQLVRKQVFPYEYIPKTVEEGLTFVCCDVDIQRAFNKTFMEPTLLVWVFCHKSAIDLEEGGVRVDEIVSRISDKVNGSRFYGMGQLELHSVKRFAPMTDYLGKAMIFYAKDWNHQYNPKAAVPVSRGVRNDNQ